MTIKVKVIFTFKSTDDIDDIMKKWAEKTDFIECCSSDNEMLVDINNVAYCYYLNQDNSKTFLTVNQIDDIVQIETWAVQGIKKKSKSVNSVNELLKMLGQKPL